MRRRIIRGMVFILLLAAFFGALWVFGPSRQEDQEERPAETLEIRTPLTSETTILRTGRASVSESKKDDHESRPDTTWFREVPELTKEQAEAFLKRQGRTPMSLLVVGLESGDGKYLLEAYQKEPDNPAVLLAVLTFKDDLLDEERDEAIQRFAELSPDSSLGDYLAASAALKGGDVAGALEMLSNGAEKTTLDSCFGERSLELEKLYRFQGLSEESALAVSVAAHRIPHGQMISDLKDAIREEAKNLMADNENEMAMNLLNAGLRMGNQVGHHEAPSLHGALLSSLIERDILSFLQESGIDYVPGYGEETVADWLRTIEQEQQDMHAIGLGGPGSISTLLQQVDNATAREYFLRSRMLGDWKAYEWLSSKAEND